MRILQPLGYSTATEHVSHDNLERYHLGVAVDEAELAPLEEHLLACPRCDEGA